MATITVLQLMESIASVSMEHEEACKCLSCRAVRGEKGALEELLLLIRA